MNGLRGKNIQIIEADRTSFHHTKETERSETRVGLEISTERHERTIFQRVSRLGSEDRQRSSPCPIIFLASFCHDFTNQIQVLTFLMPRFLIIFLFIVAPVFHDSRFDTTVFLVEGERKREGKKEDEKRSFSRARYLIQNKKAPFQRLSPSVQRIETDVFSIHSHLSLLVRQIFPTVPILKQFRVTIMSSNDVIWSIKNGDMDQVREHFETTVSKVFVCQIAKNVCVAGSGHK